MQTATALGGKHYPVAMETQRHPQGFLLSIGIANFPTEEAAEAAAARLKELVIAACEAKSPGLRVPRDWFRETAVRSPDTTEYGAGLLIGFFDREALSAPFQQVVEATIRRSIDKIVGTQPLGTH